MPNTHDVVETRAGRHFVFIHVALYDGHCVRYRWIGLTNHSGLPQLFEAVTYAHAFPEDEVQQAVYLVCQKLNVVAEFAFVEANSQLHLSPAMRKVLRV